jgi:hypothetical protein
MEEKILAAIRSFDFSDYGCDDMDDLVSDPGLDVGPHLAAHVARALQAEIAAGGAVPTAPCWCARCGRRLVSRDEAGWYCQVLAADPRMPGLTFAGRLHECDGRPHAVTARRPW